MRYATVTEIRDKRVFVTYKGESIQSQLPLYYLSSYSPELEDTVVVDVALSLCLGKVVI